MHEEAMPLDDVLLLTQEPHIEVYWPPDHASGGFLAAHLFGGLR